MTSADRPPRQPRTYPASVPDARSFVASFIRGFPYTLLPATITGLSDDSVLSPAPADAVFGFCPGAAFPGAGDGGNRFRGRLSHATVLMEIAHPSSMRGSTQRYMTSTMRLKRMSIVA